MKDSKMPNKDNTKKIQPSERITFRKETLPEMALVIGSELLFNY